MAHVTTMELRALLVRARKLLTDRPGWTDDTVTVELLKAVDAALGVVPPWGRGAYDEE